MSKIQHFRLFIILQWRGDFQLMDHHLPTPNLSENEKTLQVAILPSATLCLPTHNSVDLVADGKLIERRWKGQKRKLSVNTAY